MDFTPSDIELTARRLLDDRDGDTKHLLAFVKDVIKALEKAPSQPATAPSRVVAVRESADREESPSPVAKKSAVSPTPARANPSQMAMIADEIARKYG